MFTKYVPDEQRPALDVTNLDAFLEALENISSQGEKFSEVLAHMEDHHVESGRFKDIAANIKKGEGSSEPDYDWDFGKFVIQPETLAAIAASGLFLVLLSCFVGHCSCGPLLKFLQCCKACQDCCSTWSGKSPESNTASETPILRLPRGTRRNQGGPREFMDRMIDLNNLPTALPQMRIVIRRRR